MTEKYQPFAREYTIIPNKKIIFPVIKIQKKLFSTILIFSSTFRQTFSFFTKFNVILQKKHNLLLDYKRQQEKK